MKKYLSVLLCIALLAAVFAGCSKKEEGYKPDFDAGDVSVVSFNVAAPWGNALKGTGSSKRAKRFAKYMNSIKPDFIGTQEMNSSWQSSLARHMSDYDCYGVERGGDDSKKKSEMNTIFWLKDKFTCIQSHTFWLSETRDVESRYEGAGCNRVCSYVLLRNDETNELYAVLNTHLDNASEEARTFGANVILDVIRLLDETELENEITVILTGDFNGTIDSEACQKIASQLNTVAVEGNTYHDWQSINEGEPIDFIFSSGKVNGSVKLDDTSNGLISDHWGVYSTISTE